MTVDLVFYEVRGFLEADALIAEAELRGLERSIDIARRRMEHCQERADSEGVASARLDMKLYETSREFKEKRLATVSDLLTRYQPAVAALDGAPVLSEASK